MNVIPISSLGLHMGNDAIRVAVGLCLGARPHTCCHCGAQVDVQATHGLSCRQSEGRHHRHAAMNVIGHGPLLRFHIVLSHLASIVQMGKALMELP